GAQHQRPVRHGTGRAGGAGWLPDRRGAGGGGRDADREIVPDQEGAPDEQGTVPDPQSPAVRLATPYPLAALRPRPLGPTGPLPHFADRFVGEKSRAGSRYQSAGELRRSQTPTPISATTPSNVRILPPLSAKVSVNSRTTSFSVGTTTISDGVARQGPSAPVARQFGK